VRAQCNPDLAEDGPSKLEQILKDRHNPDLSADEEVVRLTALLDGIADTEVRLDRLEAAKCQTCQKNPGVCMKPNKHKGGCTRNRVCKTFGCMKQFEHFGDCTITNAGPRCKTFGCRKQFEHFGDCKITLIGPRCKTKGCLMNPNHEGDCKITAIVGPRCKTEGCKMRTGHGGDCTINSSFARYKTFGCNMKLNHAGECSMSANVGPRCKKTEGCGRHAAHAGDCNTTSSSQGTLGIKCDKALYLIHDEPSYYVKKPCFVISPLFLNLVILYREWSCLALKYPEN
jgi:hypothetical protein